MSSPVYIAPSMLAADFTHLGRDIKAVQQAGAHWIHWDVMDGHFVPNISFGTSVIRACRDVTSLPFDVHLMVSNPDQWIKDTAAAGANSISVHYESTPHIHRTLAVIKEHGKKAGLALCPATPHTVLGEHILDNVDMILVMTVNPGFGGQTFLSDQLEKIRHIKQMTHTRDIIIQVDGGITDKTAPLAIKAGATSLVAGSYVFKDINTSIKTLTQG